MNELSIQERSSGYWVTDGDGYIEGPFDDFKAAADHKQEMDMDFKWHIDNMNFQRAMDRQQRMPGAVYAALFFVLMSTILVYYHIKAYVADKQVMAECLKYHTPQDCKELH